MKILLFSDTHLYSTFDEREFNFLKKIISSADRVIIAGDLWEGNIITFDEFVNSPWNKLFLYLKKKKTVYVCGNHDSRNRVDSRADLFSEEQTLEYAFSSGKKKFLVQHGHTYTKKLHQLGFLAQNKTMFTFIHSKIEKTLVKAGGKKFLGLLFGRYNKEMKRKIPKNPKDAIYIFGHTHVAELDIASRFINTGMIRHGIGQYVIIENGNISLHEESY